MPWLLRSHLTEKYYWFAGGVLGALLGIIVGYEWGTSASVLSTVEKHLQSSEAHFLKLEKRVDALEAKLSMDTSPDKSKPDAKSK